MAKKNGLIVLVLVFCIMYVLNYFTPLLADDYFSAFVWPEGMGINTLPKDARKIASFSDVFETLQHYYFIWGGRIPGYVPLTFFSWQGKEYFNFLNSFVMTIIVAEIYWLSHEGKITFQFTPSSLFWIFFALWTFNISFTDTCLWLTGACNYIWMVMIVLAFLLPYVENFFDSAAWRDVEHPNLLIVGMFFLGLLAGWSHETTNCWIALTLFYWLYKNKKKGNLQLWQITGCIGFCLGYCLLIFAPGNFSRLHILHMLQNTKYPFLPIELLQPKLVEIKLILIFHFFLWVSIIHFFLKYKKNKKKFLNKDTALYINLSILLVLIACGSSLILFLIPTNGLRPSFLHLVYLIIAVSLLFRVQEKNNISFVNKKIKMILRIMGCVYLCVTVAFAFRGNYLNWCYWNNVLLRVNETKKQSEDVIIEVPPAPTSGEALWLIGSGFHMVPITISDNERNGFNQMFSRYYGIKGIKINSHVN